MFPRTHITSDMCFPGRETQNTEAMYPSLQMASQSERQNGGSGVSLQFSKIAAGPALEERIHKYYYKRMEP